MLTKKERVGMVIAFRIATVILALLVLTVDAIFWGHLREGIEDTVSTRFESDPPEGYQYWYDREFREVFPGNVIFSVATCAISGLLLWLAFGVVKITPPPPKSVTPIASAPPPPGA